MAINFVPSGAGISIPLWYVEAPWVGDERFPKYELILVYPGIGHLYVPKILNSNSSSDILE